MRRRGRSMRGLHQMAAPLRTPAYTGETIPIRTVGRRTSPPSKGGGGWLLVPFVLIIVVLAAVLGGLTYLDQTYSGRIYPNVSVQGVNLTEMTSEQAEQ